MEKSYEYIVVGSGAGGGPLAARLAEAGKWVLLIDAGGTPRGDLYDIPGFFIAVPIYLIAEKAADNILEELKTVS
ncbi:MAG: hypothetical protein R3C01_12740 [Planctomycetaceae bacterium]